MFPLIGAIASIGSALIGANASNQAAGAQQQATRQAQKYQQQQFTTDQGLLQPAIDAGNTARGYQLGALGLPGGVDSQTATNAFRTSPGYDFALKTGQNQVETGAAAGGNLFSGKTLKDLATYGQGQADQQFGNWYGRVGGIADMGTNATGGLINAGTANANNLSNLATNAGDNRASSYITGANAATGGLQNLSDLAAYYGQRPQVAQPPRTSSYVPNTNPGGLY